MPPSRPLLRYHGGKWKLAPWIVSHFPAHRVYVEPFGGGASVLLRKAPSYAEVYNDLDSELVNAFRMVRERGAELAELLTLTPFAREEFALSYEPAADPLEQARRTIVRSFQGFGSNSHNKPTGFRSNSNRSGTTPARDWRRYPEAMTATIDRLRGVVIENRNALEVMAAHDGAETLHYVDPPYVAGTRDAGGDYRFELSDQQHRELSELLHSLKGYVVLSGYASELYEQLYGDWLRVERPTHADGGRPRTEVLWLSPNVSLPRSLLGEVA